MDGNVMRTTILEIIKEREGSHNLQSRSVLHEAAQRLNLGSRLEDDQALLTFWHDLFRSGYLAWGYNVENADPPFCHVTDRGRRVLASISRDPANPEGYMAYATAKAKLGGIPLSYLREALDTYNGGSFKAAAVMIGAASESLVLSLRDVLVARLDSTGAAIPAKLNDWRIKTVLGAIEAELAQRKKQIPIKLYEAFDSYWPAFTQQIRSVRNDAGHPTSIDPIDEATVHASLLIFPELGSVANALESWVASSLT